MFFFSEKNNDLAKSSLDTSFVKQPQTSFAIQGFGAFLICSHHGVITYTSENIFDFTKRSAASLIGTLLVRFISTDVSTKLIAALQRAQQHSASERLLKVDLGCAENLFDITCQVTADWHVIILERHTHQQYRSIVNVHSLIRQLLNTPTLKDMLVLATKQLRYLTGYDRVLLYKFTSPLTEEAEVIAENKSVRLESYLGTRCSDLILGSTTELVSHVAHIYDKPRKVIPQNLPGQLQAVLAHCVLTVPSPSYLTYLKTLDINAAFTVMIIINGKRWGVFVCHNVQPCVIDLHSRMICELLVEALALEIAQREIQSYYITERHICALITPPLDKIPDHYTLQEELSFYLPKLKRSLACDGVGIWITGDYSHTGLSFTKEQMQKVSTQLQSFNMPYNWHTHNLSTSLLRHCCSQKNIAGVLIIPLGITSESYLIYFRQQATQIPPLDKMAGYCRLSPAIKKQARLKVWQQLMQHSSDAWEDQDIKAAETVRVKLTELIRRHQRTSQNTSTLNVPTLRHSALNHRLKNILSLAYNLLEQTNPVTSQRREFSEIINPRIIILATTHSHLTSDRPVYSLLQETIELMIPVITGSASVHQFQIFGPTVHLKASAVSVFLSVLYEMLLNTLQHGVLKTHTGIVKINWYLEEAGHLVICWQEQGGPPLIPPTRHGFGSVVLQNALQGELQGRSTLVFEEEGLLAEFWIPQQHLYHVSPARPGYCRHKTDIHRLLAEIKPKSLVVIEEDIVTALHTEIYLKTLGVLDVKKCTTLKAALMAIETQPVPDYVLLALRLDAEKNFFMAQRLKELKIPFAFCVSCAGNRVPPPQYQDTPLLVTPLILTKQY